MFTPMRSVVDQRQQSATAEIHDLVAMSGRAATVQVNQSFVKGSAIMRKFRYSRNGQMATESDQQSKGSRLEGLVVSAGSFGPQWHQVYQSSLTVVSAHIHQRDLATLVE